MEAKNTTSPPPAARTPRVISVKQARRLTPNMIRVTFAGEELADVPTGREGANCKILVPEPGQSREAFAAQLEDGPRPVIRTYTVRHFRQSALEMDIDFVVHGDAGPASAWANAAREGSFCGFRGPSGVKVEQFVADWYLVAADMSALPVASATLEAMPRDAKGVAVFEITTAADRQVIDAPPGIDVHWILHPDPHVPSLAQVDFVRHMRWRDGRVQTCIAGESGVIRAMRGFLHKEKQLPRADTYISGYWKIGLIEDEHQKIKRLETD